LTERLDIGGQYVFALNRDGRAESKAMLWCIGKIIVDDPAIPQYIIDLKRIGRQ
jgi:hypothetical protein